MTPQQLFNKVYCALRKQGRPSHDGEFCRYRMVEKGKVLKCAVGCLIARKDYKEGMEGSGVAAICHLLPAELREHTSLLTKLQQAHDHNAYHFNPGDEESFLDPIAKVARDRGLTVPA